MKLDKQVVKRVLHVALLLSPAVAMLLLLGIYFLIFKEGIPCAFHEMTGMYCTGCGGTRMVISILKLQFYQAFRYNPFLFITLPFLIGVGVFQSRLYIIKGRLSHWLDYFLIAYAIALAVFGIIRNFEIFKFLRPTVIS